MRLHATLEERLVDVRARVAQLRERLGVLDAQDAYQRDVAEDARRDALTDGSPLAARERRDAEGDARRVGSERDEVARELAALRAKQDALLERLFTEQANEGGRR